MHRFFSKLRVAGPIAAIALTLAATAAHAQKVYTVQSGRTTIVLDSGFVAALGTLGVSPGTVSPGALGGGKVAFPITSGDIDPWTARTEILHSGGLTFTAGTTKVRAENFIIDTTAPQPVVTAQVIVGGKLLGRYPLFNLVPPSGLKLPLTFSGDTFHLPDGFKVTLTKTGADALNSIFNVKAFQAGFPIGSAAHVSAILAVN